MDFGLKRTTRIVTPVLLYTARVAVGPTAVRGVLGGDFVLLGAGEQPPGGEGVQ